MLKRLSTFCVFLAGLLSAQVIAAIQVFFSNRDMHHRLTALAQSGYPHLPDAKLMDMLQSWQPAWAGGLFFTLSIGAGITLATLAALWIWQALCSANKWVRYGLLCLWLGLIVALNLNGAAGFPTLYFLLIPWIVYFGLRRIPRQRPVRGIEPTMACHLICIALLALLWSTQARNGMFLAVRDNLLLTNPVGRSINDFYYRNTHYSAEAITPLQQKLFKTCSLSNGLATSDRGRLERSLSKHGYLLIAEALGPDIRVQRSADRLVFLNRHTIALETSLQDFLDRPQAAFKAVSRKADRNLFFRRTIFYSLLLAFPTALYWMLHTLLYGAASLFLAHRRASLVSILICFIIGAALILPVQKGSDGDVAVAKIPSLLASNSWQDQAAGLKTIVKENLEILQVGEYRPLLDSTHIPVQYWLAQALGRSRQAETYPDLLRLLQSPHINVVCQALFGMGQRGDGKAVARILEIIDTSDHWYVLRYAYHALRNLGWKHRPSA